LREHGIGFVVSAWAESSSLVASSFSAEWPQIVYPRFSLTVEAQEIRNRTAKSPPRRG